MYRHVLWIRYAGNNLYYYITESLYIPFPLVPDTTLIPSVSTEGTPIAGQQFSLICNITKATAELTNSPTAQWMDSNGQPVTSTNGSITVTITNTDLPTVHTITFSPLRTSQGGQYTCRGTIQSPLLTNPATVSITENVAVTGKGYYRISSKNSAGFLLIIHKPCRNN